MALKIFTFFFFYYSHMLFNEFTSAQKQKKNYPNELIHRKNERQQDNRKVK